MKSQLFRNLLVAAAVTSSTGFCSQALAAGGALTIGSQRVNYVVVPVQAGQEGEDFLVTNYPKVTERDAATFIRIVSEVGNMVAPLQVPQQMKINLAPISLSPSANWVQGELNMGVRFGMYDAQKRLHTQNPSVMTAVLAHEFGHMIFGQNILTRMPFFQQFVAYVRESQQLTEMMKRLQDEHDAIRIAAEKAGRATPEQIRRAKELEQQFAQLAVKFEAIQKKYEPALAGMALSSSYNEFFADVVATVYTENPNAVAEAIHFSMPGTCYKENGRVCSKQGLNQRRASIENREFDKVGSSPKYASLERVHSTFFAVRRWMNEEYLKRPSVLKNQKSELVLGVARAIVAELTEVSKIQNLGQQNDVVNVLNKRLAERIKAELGEMN